MQCNFISYSKSYFAPFFKLDTRIFMLEKFEGYGYELDWGVQQFALSLRTIPPLGANDSMHNVTSAMFSRIQQSTSSKCALELEEYVSAQNCSKNREGKYWRTKKRIIFLCVKWEERRLFIKQTAQRPLYRFNKPPTAIFLIQELIASHGHNFNIRFNRLQRPQF